MGQYYKALLISGESELMESPREWDNGCKLMEHSWIGNDFVNAVMKRIEGRPTRVAWIGDYSNDAVNDETNLGDGFIVGKDPFMEFYEEIWGKKIGAIHIAPKHDVEPFALDLNNCEYCFLVNKTKCSYLDIEKYVKNNRDKRASWSGCINPLPLLTAVGNGLGGGDYHGINKYSVGSWAFDEIYVTTIRPSTMTEVEFRFVEN